MASAASLPCSSRSAAYAARAGVLASLSLSFVVSGCIDHLNNARVRGAEEFECKRAEVEVTEVAEHVFVARGCEQVGAYRCEAGLEGGCKKIQGKAGDKAIALAPESEPEDGDKPKKKKKKATQDGEEPEKKGKDDEAEKPKKGATSERPDGSAKSAKDEEASKTSKEAPETDSEKPKKKKKKKSEDE